MTTNHKRLNSKSFSKMFSRSLKSYYGAILSLDRIWLARFAFHTVGCCVSVLTNAIGFQWRTGCVVIGDRKAAFTNLAHFKLIQTLLTSNRTPLYCGATQAQILKYESLICHRHGRRRRVQNMPYFTF